MAFMTILPMNTPLWLDGIQIQIHPIMVGIADRHANIMIYTTNVIFEDLVYKLLLIWIYIE